MIERVNKECAAAVTICKAFCFLFLFFFSDFILFVFFSNLVMDFYGSLHQVSTSLGVSVHVVKTEPWRSHSGEDHSYGSDNNNLKGMFVSTCVCVCVCVSVCVCVPLSGLMLNCSNSSCSSCSTEQTTNKPGFVMKTKQYTA